MTTDKPEFCEFLSETEVRLGERTFEFRDPNLWTIGEVCDIEEASTVFEDMMPKLKQKVLIQKTLAHVVKDLTEVEVESLPYHIGKKLYDIVKPRPVPLSDWLTSNSEQAAEE